MILFSLLVSPAAAWEFTPHAWSFDAPVSWQQAPSDLAGLPPGETNDLARDAFSTWDQAECSGDVSFVEGALDPQIQGAVFDGVNTVSFDDANDFIIEAGVLSSTFVYRVGVAFVYDGEPISWAEDADIIVNDGFTWATDEAIAAGGCTDAYSLRSVLTHEVGHFLGSGHSKVAGATMEDLDLFQPCDASHSSLEADDLAFVRTWYGPTVGMACNEGSSLAGATPFEVTCESWPLRSSTYTMSWQTGDGAVADTADLAHTYQAEGAYELVGCAQFPDEPTCAEQCTTFEVLVCDAPAAALAVEPAPESGSWVLLNETPIAVEGCVDAVSWTVRLDGQEVITTDEWEPTVALDEPGTYEVELSVGGPGGTSVATGTIEVPRSAAGPDDGAADPRGRGGCGCATGSPPGAPLALLVLLVARSSAGRRRAWR